MKEIVLKQYQNIVNGMREALQGVYIPNEGWVRTIRKSLNMTGAQLARRMGMTRAWISRTERVEKSKNVTLKTMDDMAKAMGCRFVYAFVPNMKIEEIIYLQAKKKATRIVDLTNKQMAMEEQAVSEDNANIEIENLAKQLINKMPSDFWDPEI